MKKLLLVFMLFSGIFITGCSVKTQNSELLKQQNILLQEQNKLLQKQLSGEKATIKTESTDNFKKSQDCEKYSSEIIQAMNRDEWEEPIIFYSSKLNTCVYGWRTYEWWDTESMPNSIYFLADILTKENIYFSRDDHSERELKIKELK